MREPSKMLAGPQTSPYPQDVVEMMLSFMESQKHAFLCKCRIIRMNLDVYIGIKTFLCKIRIPKTMQPRAMSKIQHYSLGSETMHMLETYVS
jgi:hypothetical protein